MDVINKHDIFAIVETHATHDAKLSIRNLNIFGANSIELILICKTIYTLEPFA